MLKFFLGTVLGAAMAFGYVRWDLDLPEFLQLPGMLKGNLVSTAVEGDLYDLDQPFKTRRRALEIFFQNRPKFAVSVDAEFGHPFLKVLYRKSVIRAARIIKAQGPALDRAFEKPELRKVLEKTHGTTDPELIRKRFLLAQFRKETFLVKWVEKNIGPVTEKNISSILQRLAEP